VALLNDAPGDKRTGRFGQQLMRGLELLSGRLELLLSRLELLPGRLKLLLLRLDLTLSCLEQ